MQEIEKRNKNQGEFSDLLRFLGRSKYSLINNITDFVRNQLLGDKF